VIVLDLDSVGKSFGGRRILTSATLRAEAGHVTTLLGRNGAGKSTLLTIAAGVILADYGRIVFRDRMWERPTLAALAREGLFFLPMRDLLIPTMRVGTQLDLVTRTFGTNPDGALLDQLRVKDLRARRPLTLSGGERRRADLAAAVCRTPVCLLADEPLRDLAPLDAECCADVLRSLARAGCAVVVTGHEVESLLHVADRVVWCTEGTTYDLGTPASAADHSAFRRGYLADP
jgi:lipopolysaccharide export system ATP-binding protein